MCLAGAQGCQLPTASPFEFYSSRVAALIIIGVSSIWLGFV
jgi:hypothetical protein